MLGAKGLVSVPLREKKQEKLKSNQYNNKTASKLGIATPMYRGELLERY